MLLRNIFKSINYNSNNTNFSFKSKRNICYRNCPEDENFFSTTFKVNSFLLLVGIFINNNILNDNYIVQSKFNEIKKKMDNLEKKMDNLEKNLEKQK